MNLLLIAQAPASFYRCPLIRGSKQLFIGPDVTPDEQLNSDCQRAIQLDPAWLNGKELAKILGKINFEPSLVAIKADATCRNHIKHISAIPGRKILLMGDTHHMTQPLQKMLHYALSEPWDLISSEHDRQHLLLFHELGLENLVWLPCYTMNPHKLLPNSNVNCQAIFVGSLSGHHQYRRHIIKLLQVKGVPIQVKSASQAEASQLYNRFSISLNVSLNGDLNFRVMEILAAGGCLVTDRLGPDSGLSLLLKEGEHYIGYSSAEEAAEQIRGLLMDPDRRFQIAKAGYDRFWTAFSPAVQNNVLLSALSNKQIPSLFRAPA